MTQSNTFHKKKISFDVHSRLLRCNRTFRGGGLNTLLPPLPNRGFSLSSDFAGRHETCSEDRNVAGGAARRLQAELCL